MLTRQAFLYILHLLSYLICPSILWNMLGLATIYLRTNVTHQRSHNLQWAELELKLSSVWLRVKVFKPRDIVQKRYALNSGDSDGKGFFHPREKHIQKLGSLKFQQKVWFVRLQRVCVGIECDKLGKTHWNGLEIILRVLYFTFQQITF